MTAAVGDRRAANAGDVDDPAERRRRPEREARARARLDGLAWCRPLGPYRAVGFSFGVRVMDPALADYLAGVLAPLGGPPGRTDGSVYSLVDHGETSRSRYSLYLGGLRVIRTPLATLALSYLFWHINRSVIRESPGHVLLHASAAACGDRAVVMPAAQESGKTTLVAGLVQRGLRYLTDEAVALDPASGLIEPFPKPLSVDAGSWRVLAALAPVVDPAVECYLGGQWHVPATAIKADALAGPCRPAVVVSPTYVPGAATALEQVSRAKGLLLMADNCFNFAVLGSVALDTLAAVVRSADCYRLTVGSLDEACDVVIDLLGGS